MLWLASSTFIEKCSEKPLAIGLTCYLIKSRSTFPQHSCRMEMNLPTHPGKANVLKFVRYENHARFFFPLFIYVGRTRTLLQGRGPSTTHL
jgi:hypothetical protein